MIYGTTLDNELAATSAADGHVLWSTPDCGNHEQNFALGGDTAPAVTADAVWLSDGPFLTGVRRSDGHRFACIARRHRIASVQRLADDRRWSALRDFGTRGPGLRRGHRGPAVAHHAPVRLADRRGCRSSTTAWSWCRPATAPSCAMAPSSGCRRADGSSPVDGKDPDLPSGLAATGGRVYAGGSPGAWNIRTGATIWTRPGYVLDGGVSVSGGRVYLIGGEADTSPGGGNPDGDVIALDANTGQTLWETNFASEGGGRRDGRQRRRLRRRPDRQRHGLHVQRGDRCADPDAHPPGGRGLL